ncbi:hypothetical protein HYH03_002929 [Edaphochlamys debaryana]|uniref:protein-serine/threonine phosphatase n=1 Tax=Edaphochlamys debaryana TaxID=47281 RepID=A0A835YKH4_9CHLO|nr:hypothetical protein HYH03_002929 [Edaphochlamys debaryana]|eukprot:KAG2499354.1 hypothetical protein HYH03_002929 [Edaphochlamys debaryana]
MPLQRKSAFRKPVRVLKPELDAANRTQALQAGNVKLCYAACTQAGADWIGDKPNQDCWAAQVLRPRDRAAAPVVLFGVFDGHGDEGGTVAAEAAEALPGEVQDSLWQGDTVEEALSAAFPATHAFLLQQPGLDCSLSGCTAVVAALAGDCLVVANAGDSRCIIGRFEGANEVAAFELTNDHTPCLMAEANRVLASGGRIGPFTVEGRSVGPPRVWERAHNAPGLCITRSLGDTRAKRLGVTASPELLSLPLTVDDRYLALVSDGITEFISSGELVELLHAWASTGVTPDEVARRLVREARKRWKERGGGDVIDDCTAIIAYIVYDPDDDGTGAGGRASGAGAGVGLGGGGAGGKAGGKGGKGKGAGKAGAAGVRRVSQHAANGVVRRRGSSIRRQAAAAAAPTETWGEWAEQMWSSLVGALPWSLTHRSKRRVITI